MVTVYEDDEACGCEAVLPEMMTISSSGTMATCWHCGYRSALWECACELLHDCGEEAN